MKVMGTAGIEMGTPPTWLGYLRRQRLALFLLGTVVALWAVAAKIVVPRLIEAAYRGESLAMLNALFVGRTDRPVHVFLDRWNDLAVGGLVAFLIFWVAAVISASPAFYRRFVGPATPGTLGAIRMFVFAVMLAAAIWEDLASSALLPREMRSPMGVLRLFYALPGFDAFVSSERALGVFEAFTVLLLFLGVIGWKTRLVVPLAAVCYLLLGGIIRQYTWFFHAGLIPLYVATMLAFTPCGDGWSLDRLLKVYRGRAVPPADRELAVYGWSRYMCWLVVTLAYVAAGLSKLGNDGLAWMNALALKRVMLRDTLNPMEFDWGLSLHFVHAPDVFFTTLAVATVVGELAFFFVLFSRMARLLVPAAMVSMHVGILFFQNVLFPDLIAIQLIFYNFAPLRRAVARWLERRRGTLEVLYDGVCPLCRRTVRLLAAVDLFQRLRLVDFRQLSVPEYNRRRGLSLSPDALEREMHVVSQKGVDVGFDAYRRLSFALPVLWLAAPWLFLPGVASLGRLVYRHVARNRLARGTCDAECAVDLPAGDARELAPVRERPYRLVYPLAVASVTAVLLFCWAQRIEFYPFTAMQMYTGWGPVRPITYYKVLARYESGETSRAPLEAAIPALADSRYRTVIADAFSPKKVEVSRKYLAAVASAYNRRTVPGRRVTEFEIQKWEWDFLAHPSDARYGTLSDRFVYAVQAGDSVSRRGL
jgi:predicted DCC family thiol-disulfide oxidoreductase YuxK